MKFWEKLKSTLKKSIEAMADSNQKAFGNETLDCCKLNKGSEK